MSKPNLTALVIAAHPDDEVACAGTLFKLRDKGASLSEIVLTDAAEGRDKRGITTDTVTVRRAEMDAAAKFLGLKSVFFLGQEDLAPHYSKPLMLELLKIIRQVKPTVTFLMHRHDFHPDHRAAYKLGLEASKWAATGIRPELGTPHRTRMVLQMNGMWPIRPDLLLDVTAYLVKIYSLFSIHGSQADSQAIEFEKSMLTIYGYQHRTGDTTRAEAFEFCPGFPASGLIDLD